MPALPEALEKFRVKGANLVMPPSVSQSNGCQSEARRSMWFYQKSLHENKCADVKQIVFGYNGFIALVAVGLPHATRTNNRLPIPYLRKRPLQVTVNCFQVKKEGCFIFVFRIAKFFSQRASASESPVCASVTLALRLIFACAKEDSNRYKDDRTKINLCIKHCLNVVSKCGEIACGKRKIKCREALCFRCAAKQQKEMLVEKCMCAEQRMREYKRLLRAKAAGKVRLLPGHQTGNGMPGGERKACSCPDAGKPSW